MCAHLGLQHLLAATAVSLMMSLTLFVEAWAQSAAARRDADHLQVALQVAE